MYTLYELNKKKTALTSTIFNLFLIQNVLDLCETGLGVCSAIKRNNIDLSANYSRFAHVRLCFRKQCKGSNAKNTKRNILTPFLGCEIVE